MIRVLKRKKNDGRKRKKKERNNLKKTCLDPRSRRRDRGRVFPSHSEFSRNPEGSD